MGTDSFGTWISEQTLFLVATFGNYPIGLFDSREKAEACIAEEHEKRSKVIGMAAGDYRITSFTYKGSGEWRTK